MKKTIAIILTLAIMVLGSTFANVSADVGGDKLPDANIPFDLAD